jgi:hypothetical protein
MDQHTESEWKPDPTAAKTKIDEVNLQKPLDCLLMEGVGRIFERTEWRERKSSNDNGDP